MSVKTVEMFALQHKHQSNNRNNNSNNSISMIDSRNKFPIYKNQFSDRGSQICKLKRSNIAFCFKFIMVYFLSTPNSY